jgi:hypothetical protein
MVRNHSFQMILEMQEFAVFTPAEQRYIRRSLEVAAKGRGASERWSRDGAEEASIKAQARLYRTLIPAIRQSIPDDLAIADAAKCAVPLITVSAFDLNEGKLASFKAYRFLYERLLGAAVRPWLPSAFLAAAALPTIHPSLRKALLGSMTAGDVAAAGWSIHEPAFEPEWVDKVPVTVS